MISDAYENALNFYNLKVIDIPGDYTPRISIDYHLYSLSYDGVIIDTIEKQTRIQAVQEFHRNLKQGLYNSIFVPAQSNCEVQ